MAIMIRLAGREFLPLFGQLAGFGFQQASNQVFDADEFLLLRLFGEQRPAFLIQTMPVPDAGHGDQTRKHDCHYYPGGIEWIGSLDHGCTLGEDFIAVGD